MKGKILICVMMLLIVGLISGCIDSDTNENPDVNDIRFVSNNLSKDFDWVYFANGSLAGAIIYDIEYEYFEDFDNSTYIDIDTIRNMKDW